MTWCTADCSVWTLESPRWQARSQTLLTQARGHLSRPTVASKASLSVPISCCACLARVQKRAIFSGRQAGPDAILLLGLLPFCNSCTMADQLPLNGAFWFDGLDQLGPDASMLNLEFLDDVNTPVSSMPAPQQVAAGATGPPKRRGGRRPLTAEEKAARAEKEKEQNRIMQVQ